MQPDYSDIDVGVWVPLQQPELKLPIKLPINVVKQELSLMPHPPYPLPHSRPPGFFC